ncbi:unnamed protein product [Allacma fusca]|uniref:Uncharacterized protein n=1 Tax=Allacma fusca TaxID=39272 RepID=A0A8J2P3D6_9HEXA|nr:unnamed protein product [Allacma fusca]
MCNKNTASQPEAQGPQLQIGKNKLTAGMDNIMFSKKRANFWLRLTLLQSMSFLILLAPNHVGGEILCTTTAIKYCLKCTQDATSDTDHQNQTADLFHKDPWKADYERLRFSSR